MDMEFPSEDEVRNGPIEKGTEAIVRIKLEDDGTIDFREGTTKSNKPFRRYTFVVQGGVNDGRWATLFLTLDPKNFFFRRDVSALTGVDLSQGGRVDDTLFQEKLRTGEFKVKLSSNAKDDKIYVNVDEVIGRTEITPEATPQIPVGDAVPVAEDDDIPF